MIKMANRLLVREQKRLQKMADEAKKRGGVSASLFLEGELNALTDADCFFFFGSRWRPKGILTMFFPDEIHAEITVAEFVPGRNALPALFASALRECKRIRIEQVHTVRNPADGFLPEGIDGIRFTYDWSEYMLCNEMHVLAGIDVDGKISGAELKKEEAPERDGTLRYALMYKGREAAECRILSMDEGRQCYLFGLKTKEEFRRQGMATRLLSEIAKEYEIYEGAEMRLQVSSKNEPAERLYRKLGFRTVEQREYYKTEEC